MTCVKTGADIYIIPYGEFAHCDAHECNGAFFFRISHVSRSPTGSVIHYEVNNVDSWWDRGEENDDERGRPIYSTLVADASSVISYGYEGRPTSRFSYIVDGAP